MTELIEPLRRYMLGWKACFGLAQTPGVWRRLDEWIRHRLRAIQLKHWKPGTTMYRELWPWGLRQMWRDWWRRTAVAGGTTVVWR
jgi:RNA-directed DNA polymerase